MANLDMRYDRISDPDRDDFAALDRISDPDRDDSTVQQHCIRLFGLYPVGNRIHCIGYVRFFACLGGPLSIRKSGNYYNVCRVVC